MDFASAALTACSTFVQGHIDFLLTPHSITDDTRTWYLPWIVQLMMSWIGFTIYIVWDYNAYKRGTIEKVKLPTRHPVHLAPADVKPIISFSTETSSSQTTKNGSTSSTTIQKQPQQEEPYYSFMGVPLSAFWYSQMFMVPLVLYNQFIVWPLTSFFLIWPQWQRNHRPLAEWGWTELIVSTIVLFLISDTMWYWSHRLMHVPWFWKNWHRMHHIAPQCAISATYVHAWEYCLWAIAMQLPWALAGYPVNVYVFFSGWGMVAGSSAHSGYGDEFAKSQKHNAHHYYHSVNFSLLMLADMWWGTHYDPDIHPPPMHNSLKADVEAEFPTVYQAEGGEHGESTQAEKRNTSVKMKTAKKKN